MVKSEFAGTLYWRYEGCQNDGVKNGLSDPFDHLEHEEKLYKHVEKSIVGPCPITSFFLFYF